MNSEKKEGEVPDNFGKVVEELHNKQKLSALRTYQGDMAQFIREKDESVISVKLKEKEREEKREEEEIKRGEKPAQKHSKSNFQVNVTMIALSLALLAAGVSASFYIVEFINRPTVQIKFETDLIAYNSLTTIANIDQSSLEEELAKLPPPNGIDLIKISDRNGKLLSSAKDFFEFVDIPTNFSLGRTLADNFVLGRVTEDTGVGNFIIFLVDDFGVAFSAMLDWEKNMPKDFSFIVANNNPLSPLTNTEYEWRDVLLNNKDIRAAFDKQGKIIIAYTFLDRKTILVASNLSTIRDLTEIFASRSISR